jgi:predicted transglutaminase-like cysteine proteinase
MVLVSIIPFAPRRMLFLATAFFALSIATCFANSLLVTAKKTPYDHQMARIQPVLNSAACSQPSVLPLSLVNQWIGELRAIPYSFSREWKTPNEIAHAPVADCKGKAVALYQRMRENGARNLRLVIGKRTPVSRSTHTWLEWTNASATFVLDPTINWAAKAVNEIPENSYVPYYAYAGSRKYRAAAATSLYARL